MENQAVENTESGEKPAKDCPSYLIWSIFTKQRELQKANVSKKRSYTSKGKMSSHTSKSAPSRRRQKDALVSFSAEPYATRLSLACLHCSNEQIPDEDLGFWAQVEGTDID